MGFTSVAFPVVVCYGLYICSNIPFLLLRLMFKGRWYRIH